MFATLMFICFAFPIFALEKPINTPSQKGTVITYLISAQDSTKFCNGDDMDSAGFKKTIMQLKSTMIPKTNLSRNDLIKETIILASKASNLNKVVDSGDFMEIKNGVAYMKPVDAWAGVSIFLCAFQPLVEANLARFPEIKKVLWETE